MFTYEEDILEDDANVFMGYLYVCDGEVVKSHMQGKVRDMKLTLKVKEVRRCNPFKRGIDDQMEPFVLRRFPGGEPHDPEEQGSGLPGAVGDEGAG